MFSIVQKYLAKKYFAADYKIPTNAEDRFWDWYGLMSLIDDLSKTKAFEGEEFPVKESLLEDIKHAFYFLTVALFKGFQRDLPIIVAAEMRHALDLSDNRSKMLSDSKWGPFARRYLKNVEKKAKDKFYRPGKDYAEKADNYGGDAAKIYHAIRATTTNLVEAMEFCEWCFKNLRWSGSYGGPPWARIAHAAQEILKMSDESIQIEQLGPSSPAVKMIDHIYDLEHNTKTALNKLKVYAGHDGNYDWVKPSLNLRSVLATSTQFITETEAGGRSLYLVTPTVENWIKYVTNKFSQPDAAPKTETRESFNNDWLKLKFDDLESVISSEEALKKTKIGDTEIGYSASVTPISYSYTGDKVVDRATGTSTSNVKLVANGGKIAIFVTVKGSKYLTYLFTVDNVTRRDAKSFNMSFSVKTTSPKGHDVGPKSKFEVSFNIDTFDSTKSIKDFIGQLITHVETLLDKKALQDYIEGKTQVVEPKKTTTTSKAPVVQSDVVEKTFEFGGKTYKGATHSNGGGFVSNGCSVSSSCFVDAQSVIISTGGSVYVKDSSEVRSSQIIGSSIEIRASKFQDSKVIGGTISGSSIVIKSASSIEKSTVGDGSVINGTTVSNSDITKTTAQDSEITSSTVTVESSVLSSKISDSYIDGRVSLKKGASVSKSQISGTGLIIVSGGEVSQSGLKSMGSGQSIILGKITGGTWEVDTGFFLPKSKTIDASSSPDSTKKKKVVKPVSEQAPAEEVAQQL